MCQVLTSLYGCYWNWTFLSVLLCLCQETKVNVGVKFPVDLYLECKFTLSQKRGIAQTWTRVSFIECTDSRTYVTQGLRFIVLSNLPEDCNRDNIRGDDDTESSDDTPSRKHCNDEWSCEQSGTSAENVTQKMLTVVMIPVVPTS